MPIKKVKGGYKWGNHGKVYPTRKGAEKQAAAAHANGFTEDGMQYDAAAATLDHIMSQAPVYGGASAGCSGSMPPGGYDDDAY